MFEIDWNNISPTDSLGLGSAATLSDYDKIISSQSYINSLRSGIKGYQQGKPIISGIKNTAPSFSVDTSYVKRISAFRSLDTKLCGTFSRLERKLVNFNQNITSTCIVQVTQQDLGTTSDNCECLRRILFTKLNDYFAPANVVSRNGNPNMSNFDEADWINVYPSTRNLLINDPSNQNGLNNMCFNVPYKLNVWFMFQTTGSSNGLPINEIIGSYIR